ncbi:hypothetical protein [Candidatus Enterovibrio altilux]|nr:hypothetical protein [Candidatus Enterovibrio luxaltus]
MVRVKKLLVGRLSLRDHITQTSEIDVIVKTFNKLTRLSMPNMKAIV